MTIRSSVRNQKAFISILVVISKLSTSCSHLCPLPSRSISWEVNNKSYNAVCPGPGTSQSVHGNLRSCGAHSNGQRWWRISPSKFIETGAAGSRSYDHYLQTSKFYSIADSRPERKPMFQLRSSILLFIVFRSQWSCAVHCPFTGWTSICFVQWWLQSQVLV